MKNEFFYCFRSILLGLKLNYEFLKMIRGNEIRKIVKKILKILESTRFSLGEFAIESNCESESRQKIAKRKRSEVYPILCEAKRCEFASLRNFSQFCEFALRIWSPGSTFRVLSQHVWDEVHCIYCQSPAEKLFFFLINERFIHMSKLISRS